MSYPRKHPNGARAQVADRTSGGIKSKASFCGTKATRTTENRARLNPAGGLRPGWAEPPPFAFCSTHAKRSQTENRTSHLLFQADILTCYEQKGGGRVSSICNMR